MKTMAVRTGLADSFEKLFHESGIARFSLNLRNPAWANDGLLSRPRLQRAIGVIYRPESELASHYFQADLPRQFDEFLWFDKTSAITPLDAEVPGFERVITSTTRPPPSPRTRPS